MTNLHYKPEFRISIGGQPVPSALRTAIAGVSLQSSFEGADRVELTLANPDLRWLDHPLLVLDNPLALAIGYAPDPPEQVFVGQIVGLAPTFPSSGIPTLVVSAQDRRQQLQQAKRTRWFAISIPTQGNFPLPDQAVIATVAAENMLIPITDMISAAISVLLGGIDAVYAAGDPQRRQKVIRKQNSESDYAFLQRLAGESGWEMLIDHSDPNGGHKLRFMSPMSHLRPDLSLRYGRSLIDFMPRITTVGQVAGVSVRFWLSERKLEFTITAGWDWDRSALDVSISLGSGLPGGGDTGTTVLLVDEPVTQESAPRVLISKLLARLNKRLTGSGSTIGDPRIRPGAVVQLEGVGEQFGGLYRVTSATHTIDGGGYRTSFEVRKEVWFGSIPLLEQGAVHITSHGQTLRID